MTAPRPCTCDPDVMRLLGQVEGRLGAIESGLTDTRASVHAVGARLDAHKDEGAKVGGIYGSLAAAGVAVLIEVVRRGLPGI